MVSELTATFPDTFTTHAIHPGTVWLRGSSFQPGRSMKSYVWQRDLSASFRSYKRIQETEISKIVQLIKKREYRMFGKTKPSFAYIGLLWNRYSLYETSLRFVLIIKILTRYLELLKKSPWPRFFFYNICKTETLYHTSVSIDLYPHTQQLWTRKSIIQWCSLLSNLLWYNCLLCNLNLWLTFSKNRNNFFQGLRVYVIWLQIFIKKIHYFQDILVTVWQTDSRN